MPIQLRLILIGLSLARFQSHAQPASCTSAERCNARGTKALAAGRFKAAVGDFTEEVRYAEDGMREQEKPNTAGDVLAFNNLSVAYLRQRQYPEARFWVRRALELDPNSAAAIHNLAASEAKLQDFAWPALPNGTYVQYAGCGERNQIRLTEASGSTAKMSFEGIRIGAKGCHSDTGPAAMGELDDKVAIRGQTAAFQGSGDTVTCKIQLQLKRDGVSVEEAGECGFGWGVHTSGDYERISVR